MPIRDEPDGATPVDPDEFEGLKFKHVTTRGELDQLEQSNIQDGLAWLERSNTDILVEPFVRELHRRLFGQVWNWAGTYRLTEKNIGVEPEQIAPQLRMLLDDARYWSENDTYPPLEAAVRFHHRMVKIHLFPNGNGRHARIAANVYLKERFRHAPIDWTAGHDLQSIGDRRAQYIAALRAADGGDLLPLLSLVGP